MPLPVLGVRIKPKRREIFRNIDIAVILDVRKSYKYILSDKHVWKGEFILHGIKIL